MKYCKTLQILTSIRALSSSVLTSFKITIGWEWSVSMKSSSKYGLHAERIARWTRNDLPSHDNVTSTNAPLLSMDSRTRHKLFSWLFQRNENSCSPLFMLAMVLCIKNERLWLSQGQQIQDFYLLAKKRKIDWLEEMCQLVNHAENKNIHTCYQCDWRTQESGKTRQSSPVAPLGISNVVVQQVEYQRRSCGKLPQMAGEGPSFFSANSNSIHKTRYTLTVAASETVSPFLI